MTAQKALADSAPGQSFEGHVFGGFRMVREIAIGGMATVYLAHKTGPAGFGQAAAVKVIHPHLARDRDFVDMFLDEARLVSCINHPNVCRVLDFGQAEGTYYLAMEYVMGETWGDVLHTMKHRPEAHAVIAPVLAQVLAQACEGLHAAHEAHDAQGKALAIVHRDISPQNLIVGYDGSVRVLDFGIASAAERLHTTRNGTIKGRFAYMAPEQMRGLPVDRRADLWSLGVLLWEGLARRRLFKRDTEAETVLAVTHDPLPSVHEAGHDVPEPLAQIARTALERKREDRYPTARDMGLELARFAGSAQVAVGMAEVSLWMHRLFGERIELKREVLRAAARVAETEIGFPTSGLAVAADNDTRSSTRVEPTGSGVVEAGGTSGPSLSPSVSTVREIAREELAAVAEPTPALPSRTPSPRAKPLVRMAIAAGALAAAAWLALGGKGRTPEPGPRPAPPPPAAHLAPPPPPAAPPEAPSAPAAEVSDPAVSADATDTPSRAGKRTGRALSAAQKRKPELGIKGAVNIATPGGWAEVYLGGRKLGTTPGRFELPVGSHVLRLRPFGKPPELSQKVVIVRDAPAKVRIPIH